MSETLLRYGCRWCGKLTPQYVEQCPGCKAFDCMESIRPVAAPGRGAAGVVAMIGKVPGKPLPRVPCGLAWFDDLAGGGFVRGRRVLLGGEPGSGKSRLMFQAAAGWAGKGQRVLIVCAEMGLWQTWHINREMGLAEKEVLLTEHAEAAAILAAIKSAKPRVVIVDSLNRITDRTRRGAAGENSQLTTCLERIGSACQAAGILSIFLAHLNANGRIAGPRALDHDVDATLKLNKHGKEGSGRRMLVVRKHRDGPECSIELAISEKGLSPCE